MSDKKNKHQGEIGEETKQANISEKSSSLPIQEVLDKVNELIEEGDFKSAEKLLTNYREKISNAWLSNELQALDVRIERNKITALLNKKRIQTQKEIRSGLRGVDRILKDKEEIPINRQTILLPVTTKAAERINPGPPPPPISKKAEPAPGTEKIKAPALRVIGRDLNKMGINGVKKLAKYVEGLLIKRQKESAEEAEIEKLKADLKDIYAYFDARFRNISPIETQASTASTVAAEAKVPAEEPEAKTLKIESKPTKQTAQALKRKPAKLTITEALEQSAKKQIDEYKEIHELFQKWPSDLEERKRKGEKLRTILGIETPGEFDIVIRKLRQSKWQSILTENDPIASLKPLIAWEAVNEDNAANKLGKMLAELKSAISGMQPKKKQQPLAKPQKRAQKPAAAQINPPPRPIITTHAPVTPKPQNKPTPELGEYITNATGTRKAFLEQVNNYTKDNADRQQLFVKVMNVLEKVSADEPGAASLKNKIENLFNVTTTRIARNPAEAEQEINKFFQAGLNAFKEQIEKVLAEHEEKSEIETYALFYRKSLEPELKRIAAIRKIKASDIQNPEHRRVFEREIMPEIKGLLAEMRENFPLAKLEQTMSPADKRRIVQDMRDTVEEYEESVEYFEEEILPALPDAIRAEYKNTTGVSPSSDNHIINLGPAGTQTSPIPLTDPKAPAPVPLAYPSAPTGSPSLAAPATPASNEPAAPTDSPILLTNPKPAASDEPVEVPALKSDETPTETTENNLRISEEARKLLGEVLSAKDLIREDDPVCLAISAQLKGRNDLDEIKNFLKNPSLLNKMVGPDTKDAIKAEMNQKGAASYEDFKQVLKWEQEKIQDLYETVRGRRPSKDEEEQLSQARVRKTEINQMMGTIDLLISIEKRSINYDSPREVLGLINLYLHQDQAITIDQLAGAIDTQISEHKESLNKGTRAAWNKAFFFLRPGLKSTLKALAKDKEFAKLGDDPREELLKLAKIFGGDYANVKQWAENLPGGIENHANTTIPRLTAYLEFAIREGKVSSLFRTGRAKTLVEHLKRIQRDHIRTEVENEFRSNPSMTNQQKMLLYLQKINKSEQKIGDINTKIIRSNVLKHYAGKLTGVGALGAAAVMMPAILPAAIAAPYLWIKSYSAKSKTKTELMRKGALSVALANALYLGASAISLPFAIGGALVGAGLVPAIKYRKQLKTGGGKAYEKALKPAGKGIATASEATYQHALKPSALWALKYLTPLGLYYLPKAIASGTEKTLDKIFTSKK